MAGTMNVFRISLTSAAAAASPIFPARPPPSPWVSLGCAKRDYMVLPPPGASAELGPKSPPLQPRRPSRPRLSAPVLAEAGAARGLSRDQGGKSPPPLHRNVGRAPAPSPLLPGRLCLGASPASDSGGDPSEASGLLPPRAACQCRLCPPQGGGGGEGAGARRRRAGREGGGRGFPAAAKRRRRPAGDVRTSQRRARRGWARRWRRARHSVCGSRGSAGLRRSLRALLPRSAPLHQPLPH